MRIFNSYSKVCMMVSSPSITILTRILDLHSVLDDELIEMNHTEDDYNTEDEDTFPDEESEEDTQTEDVSDVSPATEDRLGKFMEDPWLKMSFFLAVIGLIIVLFTPPEIWNPWRYLIAGNYLVIVFAAVGTIFGLKIWREGGNSNLRFGGPTNMLVILACAVVATLDTISWIITNTSFIQGFAVSLIPSMLMIIIFCFYTLWLIQRVITSAEN